MKISCLYYTPCAAIASFAASCALLFSALTTAPATARAEERIWTGEGNHLTDAANWSPNGTPTVGDTIRWDGSAAGNLDLLLTADLNSALGNITVAAAQTGSLRITNDSTTITRLLRLNSSGIFRIESGAGAVTVGDANPVNIILNDIRQLTLSNYTFANNSAHTATLGSGVSMGRGNSALTTVKFTGSGNWNVAATLRDSLVALWVESDGIVTYSGTSNAGKPSSITGVPAGTPTGAYVAKGTLNLTGTIAEADAGFRITGLGTLTGTGTAYSKTASIGGRVSPGSGAGSIGRLTFKNGLKFDAGAGSVNFDVQIADATGVAGVGFDNIDVNGTLDLASKINLNLSGSLVNFDNARNHEWAVITTDSVVSNFLVDNFSLDISRLTIDLGGGTFGVKLSADQTDVILTFTAAGNIPEPSTWTLIVGGLILAGSMIIRRVRG
ncbi:hypothetical protein OpiT1DRAFT_05218 [Opitutaceae bacterium TAV1]|nr:hypothetical protein OpiT1DRAFT_05218 [Opitutaceae bacterium TAV1]